MLKEFLCDVDEFLSKIPDVSIIPMYPLNGKASISGQSNDGQVFFSIQSKKDYNYEEFAFRDWVVISSALAGFSRDENFDIKLETTKSDGKDYPCKIIFKTKSLSINHYLQKYPALAKSEQVLKQYQSRRLTLKIPPYGLVLPNVNCDSLNELLKVAGILGKKEFSFQMDGHKLSYCLGDVDSRSSDNAKILISDGISSLPTQKLYFSIQSYNSLIKAFNYNCVVNASTQQIFITGETEHCKCMFSVRGKATES